MYRHYKVAPEPLSEEARHILAGSRDEMMNSNKGDKIMEYTKGECGCKVVLSPNQNGWGIIYCPLHKSAPDLYEALKTALFEIEYFADGDERYAAISRGEIKQALAKAEGK